MSHDNAFSIKTSGIVTARTHRNIYMYMYMYYATCMYMLHACDAWFHNGHLHVYYHM